MKRKKSRGLRLHQPKQRKSTVVHVPAVSVTKNIIITEEKRGLRSSDGAKKTGQITSERKVAHQNDTVKDIEEIEEAQVPRNEVKGEKYDRVRAMCDGLRNDGMESVVLTADTMSRKVWTCGSISGSLFLQEEPDLQEKFLRFCIKMEKRFDDEAKCEPDDTTMDLAASKFLKGYIMKAAHSYRSDGVSDLGEKTEKGNKTANASVKVSKTTVSSLNSSAGRKTNKNSNTEKKTKNTKKKDPVDKLDSSDTKDGNKSNAGCSNNVDQEIHGPNSSEEKEDVRMTRVKTLKNENKAKAREGLLCTKINTVLELNSTNVVEGLFKKGKTKSYTSKHETANEEIKENEDGLITETSNVEQYEEMNEQDSDQEKSVDDPKIENREAMFEVIKDCNSVTINTGGIDVIWPIDKVYGKNEDRVKPYFCKLCDKLFVTPSMVIRHVRGVHASDTPYQCKECEKQFKDKDSVLKHVRIHRVKTHSCDMCGKSFVDDYRLRNHKKTHEKSTVYQCDICRSEFKDRTEYRQHLSSEHGKMKLKCEECGSLFRDGFSLRRHVIVKHTSEKTVKCDICLKAFKLKDNMLLHKRRFHEAKYSCEICGTKQPSLSTLKKHKEVVHEKKNKLICDICGKTFMYRHRFKIHKRAHAGELPFKCSYCDKRYTNKESCMHHENTHTREREYICDICGQKYLQYGHLSRHKQLHDKTYKPIKCKYCDAGFRAYSGYRSHVFKEHKETELASGGGMILTCEHCGKHFAHPTHLQSHIYRHTGEKPYECDTCGKKFNDKSNLRQHKYTHGDKEAFQCNMCPKTFTQRRCFRSHLKSHGVLDNSKGLCEFQPNSKVKESVLTGPETDIKSNSSYMNSGGIEGGSGEMYNSHNKITQIQMDMGESVAPVQGYTETGQEKIDTTNQAESMEVEEIYILDLGRKSQEIHVHPEHFADFKRIHEASGGSVVQFHQVPDTVSEFHLEVSDTLNDGQNYVVVPQNEEATSTILVWEQDQN